MQKRLLGWLLFGAAVIVGLGTTARTEEEEGGDMEAWMALGTPGAEHEWLERLVGSWDVQAKFWEGPGEPTTSKGKATITSEWGGRYFDMKYRGEFGEMTFDGQGTWAYNNGAKRFEGTWRDSFSTQLAFSTGQRSGDELTMTGTVNAPQGEVRNRDVVTCNGEDSWSMTSYWTSPGKSEEKKMELVYTRVAEGD